MDWHRKVNPVKGLATPFLQWQSGLRAVQGLDLTLFVARENQGMLRRIEIETDNVLQLPLEMFVIGKLESLDSMWLEPVGRPHPPHTRGTDPNPFGHGGPTPVRGPGRLFLERQFYDARLDRRRQRADASGPGFIFWNRFKSAQGIATSPSPHLHLVLAESRGDLLVFQSLGRQKNDGCPLPGTHRTGSTSANGFQFHTFLNRQLDGRSNSPAPTIGPKL